MLHCHGSGADSEAGFTPGRTPQPMTSLQHKEVTKGWLFVNVGCLFWGCTQEQFHTLRGVLQLPWCFGCPHWAPCTLSLRVLLSSNTGYRLGPAQASIEAHKQGINLQELNISSCQPGRDLLRWLTLILMETVCRNHKLKSRRLCQKSRLHKSKWQTPSGFFCSLQRTHHYFQLLRADTMPSLHGDQVLEWFL